MRTWFPIVPRWIGHSAAAPGTWNRAALAAIRGIEDGVLLQDGAEIFAWGQPDRAREWASCGRAAASMPAWMRLATANPGVRAALDRPIRELGTPTARTFPAHLRLCDALAYIGANGQWHYSNWWREMDDVFVEITGCKLHDYFNEQIAIPLNWPVRARENSADGTPRIVGSVRAVVRWAQLMLDGWQGLIDNALIARVLGGGPDGTGQPYPLEGMQVHLFRGGRAWEYEHDELANVPDGFAARDGSETPDRGHGLIAGFPSVGVAFAYRGQDLARVLPRLISALDL